MPGRLAVLEAQWSPNYTHSLKPFFDGMSSWLESRNIPRDFYYERFVGANSLRETVRFLVARRDVRYLYLATHGDFAGIGCPNGDSVPINTLALDVSRAIAGTRLDGIFLGSCMLGSRRSAQLFLSEGAETNSRPKWVAGYDTEVNWFDSTVLDVFFMQAILSIAADGMSIGRTVSYACNEVHFKLDGLFRTMNFHVFVKQKKTGEIVDIFEFEDRRREEFLAEHMVD